MSLRILCNRLQLQSSVLFVVVMMAGGIEPDYCQGFHSGGVGSCSSCHSMHSAQSGNQQLLLSSDPSSICLNCHAGPGGSNRSNVFSPDGSALTPGGDFYWLSKSFSWIGGQSPGYDHGHNIVAIDFNLYADPILTTAPGGSYPSASLGCTSCHDPHGQVTGGTAQGGLPVSGSGSYGAATDSGAISGNYRLLGDSSYVVNGYSFSTDAPVARQSSVNQYEESDFSHVDYGSGMSEWCGNCHGGMLSGGHQMSGGSSGHHHLSGDNNILSQRVVTFYNSYLRSGDFSGTAATAYLQFVPFERGTTEILSLDPHSTQGPDVNANVMCLSCHRAHASAFPNSGRWDFTADLLVDSHPAFGDGGATLNDVYYSYYGRDIATEFGSGQGQFCEKCHGATSPMR